MKKFFITVLVMLFFKAQAQTTNPLGQQLVNVNQSSVTSGIIYERSLRTTNLVGFNQCGSWHNISNFNFFKQV